MAGLDAFRARPGLALGLAVGVFGVVAVGGFLWAQTRVFERPPTVDEHRAMITVEDLVGRVPEGSSSAEVLTRAFPSMPMLWLNYRRSGPVQVRSHLLRYDDEELAKQGVERFAQGDGEWVADLEMGPLALPDCVDGGSLTATSATEGAGSGFLLTARAAGSYVHVSVRGWAPADGAELGRGVCPSLADLGRLPFPPEE